MMNRDQMLQRLRSDEEAIVDVHTHVGISPRSYIDRGYPYCLSLEDLAIRMKALGISYSAVFPYDSFYYALTRKAQKKVGVSNRIDRFPYETANQNLLNEVFEVFPQYADLFLPYAMFDPSRKQAEQDKLLRTLAARYPLYGLKTVTSYSQAHIRDLLSDRGRCLLDVARKLDIPITIHTSVAPGDPWANVFDIVEVVAANPDLRFCLAHTCRFSKKALDEADKLANCFVDLSAFHIHCQLAVQGSPSIAGSEDRFDADYSRPLDALNRLVECYPTTLCWGTDTPAYYFINRWVDDQGKGHWIALRCDWDVEAKALGQLSRETRRLIAHKNPLRLLAGADPSF
jgi:predicted TIM-barrel fold metal-dependent hydrolase